MSANPLSSRVTRRSMQVFLQSNVLWSGYAICTYGALYTGMLLAVGMSQRQIGWIMSVTMFTLPFQVLGAIIQQRSFNRKVFWVSTLAFYLAMIAILALLVAAWPAVPTASGVVLFFVLLVLANIGFQLHRPVQLAWQTDVVPERESSAFWSRLTSQGMVAGVVAGFAMGWLADQLGRDNRLTYVLLLGVGLMFAALSLRLNAGVPDPEPEPRRDAGGVFRSMLSVIRDHTFQRLSVVFSLHSVANWLCAAFIFVHLQRTMRFSMFQMQMLAGISCLVSFAAGRLFAVVGRHYGRKPVLLICTLVKSVEFVLWGMMRPGGNGLDAVVRGGLVAVFGDGALLPAGFVSAVPVFMLGGFVNVGIASTQLAFMRSIGTRQNQTLAISLFLSLSGVIGGVVAGLSGTLINLLGTPGFGPELLRRLAGGHGLTPFNVLALAGAGVFALCAFFIHRLKEDGAAPTMHVVRVLLASNPVRGVYHAQTLANALTEATRSQILNQARSGLVETERVRDLYSCSSQVRDSAMRNLAGAGDTLERVQADALIHLLGVPELGLQVEAAKMLGRCRHAPALPHLTACFDAQDANLAGAAIYAAGLIGDPAARPELRRVLEADDAPPMQKALAAEAMSRMCDARDARLIFNAFVDNTHPVLVTQCLVSLCRCMEDGVHVYPLFEDEMRNPGVSAAALLDTISRCHPQVDPDALGVRLDAHAFLDVATAVIEPVVSFCLPCSRPSDVGREDFLRSLFEENGRFSDARLSGSDYVATSLWLQLRLWTYLAYSSGEQDRYVLLTILFLCDRLSKRLDPSQPRKRRR